MRRLCVVGSIVVVKKPPTTSPLVEWVEFELWPERGTGLASVHR